MARSGIRSGVSWSGRRFGTLVDRRAIPNFGDKETFRAEIRGAFERTLKAPGAAAIPGAARTTERVVNILVIALPRLGRSS